MRPVINIIYARKEDCALLAAVMSEEDKAHLLRGWGVEPEKGLLTALSISYLCWSAFVDNEIVIMFGCADGDEPGIGIPWLVTAPGIERWQTRFVRQSLRYLPRMFERYAMLVCHAYKENEPLVNWIRWLGFEIEDLNNGFVKGVLHKCVYRQR
jgi:hypothetical protein